MYNANNNHRSYRDATETNMAPASTDRTETMPLHPSQVPSQLNITIVKASDLYCYSTSGDRG